MAFLPSVPWLTSLLGVPRLEVGVCVNCHGDSGSVPQRLSPAEEQSHFALWALLKAPLLMGADPTNLTDHALSVLTNSAVVRAFSLSLSRARARSLSFSLALSLSTASTCRWLFRKISSAYKALVFDRSGRLFFLTLETS